MAKFYSSTFGEISGKHGNAVAVTRKDGTTYIRIYAKPSNPRTDKQQAHRAKFALSSRALVPFNPIFKDTIGVTNGISAARSHTFKNAIVGEYPNFSIDYEKIMFSFGPLAKLHNSSVKSNDGVVSINWDFDKMYNCHSDDSVNLVVFNKESNQALHIKDVALRADTLTNISIQDSWADSELHLWAYLTNGDKISDSVFVGKCRPSDIIQDSPEVDLIQDYEMQIDNNEPDTSTEELKSNYSFAHFNAYEAIISILMMVYNLLGLFKQAVVGSNIKDYVKVLECRLFGVMEYVGNIDKEREYNHGLKSNKRSIFEVLYERYQHMSIPIPIPIIITNNKHGAIRPLIC